MTGLFEHLIDVGCTITCAPEDKQPECYIHAEDASFSFRISTIVYTKSGTLWIDCIHNRQEPAFVKCIMHLEVKPDPLAVLLHSYMHSTWPAYHRRDEIITMLFSHGSHALIPDKAHHATLLRAAAHISPCPCCGSEAHICNHMTKYAVQCLSCALRSTLSTSPSVAIDAWNRRVV